MTKGKVFKNDILIKFVRKAQMWCRTHWNEKGEQIQEWFVDKPEMTLSED